MAGYRGKDLAYLSLDDGTGHEILTNTKGDLTFNFANGEIDVRDDTSAGYNEAIIGDQTATISGTFNYQLEAAAQAQLMIIDAAEEQTSLECIWGFEGTTGARQYTADGFVTNCSCVNGDPETIAFTIRIQEIVGAGIKPAPAP